MNRKQLMTIPQGMTWPSACQVPIHFQSISSGSFRLLHLRLLFVGRSLNMIRSANFALGTAVNRVAILAECAAAGQGREGFQNRNPVVAKIFHKITQRFGWIWNIMLNLRYPALCFRDFCFRSLIDIPMSFQVPHTIGRFKHLLNTGCVTRWLGNSPAN